MNNGLRILRRCRLAAAAALLAVLAGCASTGAQLTPGAREANAGSSEAAGNLDMVPVVDLEKHDEFHFGVGFMVAPGSPVTAAFDGTVHALSRDPQNQTNLGRFVQLEHQRVYTAADGTTKTETWYSLYALLGDTKVAAGEQVRKGQEIGTAGPSGPLPRIDPGTSFMFALYTRERYARLDAEWGEPIPFYGVYWYDPQKALGNGPPPAGDGGFDYSAYLPTDLQSLAARVSDEAAVGLEFLGATRHRLRIELAGQTPAGLSSRHRELLALYGRQYGIDPGLLSVFGGELTLREGGRTYVFLIQEPLLPFMEAELRTGDTVDLYILFGLYDGARRELIGLVNEFQRID